MSLLPLQIEFHDNFTAVVGEAIGSIVLEDPVVSQAANFGGQVKWLEDNDLFDDRDRIRKAWRAWLRQFEGTEDYHKALEAYYDVYCA